MFNTVKKITLVLATLAPTTALADWTGGYVALTYGQTSNGEFDIDFESSATDIADSDIIGGAFGYLRQNGAFVSGTEIAFSQAEDADRIGGSRFVEVDGLIWDIKYRVGYAAQDFLPYASVGVSSIGLGGDDVDITGSGWGFGVGADYLISDRLILGVEYYARRTRGTAETGSGTFATTGDFSTDIDSISLRVGYKF